ncbi:MAG: hypothetical protein LQ350_007818 [Teloschistes chrysophthalmus]|nr:MAG: hypothetical protein LQ350_007818 [Niorma chrysophthalma]
MNRFKSRKKSFHDGSAEPSRRPSIDQDTPTVPIFSSKTFRRNKRIQPEPKPQIDLTTALPSSDNFRTSLLLPNLSQRFSMLREQDDPHSKIGKASDDSVLFPRRASRLDLFNSAEDGSTRMPRPPFASIRTESYGSDGSNWMDDDRSVMSRARPGEGNTMFGGRQKIYKIPVGASGSTKSFGVDDARPRRGKALYGDDLSMSMFFKSNDQDASGHDNLEADTDGHGRSSDERSSSPPLAKFNRNRGTTSSTNSGPSGGRNSTAATSVASQRSVYGEHGSSGVTAPHVQAAPHPQTTERPAPKSRRMYGQGLDQHIHDQQYSSLHRLESIQRQRANGAPPSARSPGSRSATNLNDRYQRSGSLNASNEFRAASPPPSGPPPRMGDFDLGLPTEPPENDVDSGVGRSPPLSPPMSPTQDNTFVAALEPNDIGKATASGAFNKPSKQYNEQQYLQRQLQLQHGRESPSLIRPFSPSAASIDEQMTGRSRNVSFASPQSNSASPPLHQEPHVDTKNLNELADKQHPAMRTSDDQYNPAMDSSFLSTMSESEVGSPLDSDNDQEFFPPRGSYQNPANPMLARSDLQSRRPQPGAADDSQAGRLHPTVRVDSGSDSRSEVTVTEQQHRPDVPQVIPNHVETDSPTLGPTIDSTSPNGLSGLVRAHLRNDSNQSSIYPEPSPARSKFPHETYKASHSRNQSRTDESATFFRDSTFAAEDQGIDRKPPIDTGTTALQPPLSMKARQFLEQAPALRDESPKVQQMLSDNKAQKVLGREAPRPSHEHGMTWQEQLRAHHTRGGSTETEKERECLATELAERRRAVQDKLQSFVENESRSSSPVPGSRPQDGNYRRTPFGTVKSKNSKDSLPGRQEQSFKAMKMLGINPNANVGNGSPRPSQDSFFKRSEESSSWPQNRGQQQSQLDGPQPRFHKHSRRLQKPESQPGSRPESFEKNSPPTTSRSSRERSSSETSERRYGNRNVRPRQDALIEEEMSGSNPASPSHRNRPRKTSDAPRPVEELIASMAAHQKPDSAASNRARSNSRPTVPGYFERPDAMPIQPNASSTSPLTPSYSIRSAPSMHEGSSLITNESIPVMIPPASSHGAFSGPRHHKSYRNQSINKQDISEPIFKSSTASVDVVDLPPGASLKNGMDYSFRPPIPPLNPARRKRTQNLLQALGRLEKSHPVPASSQTRQIIANDPYGDRSPFSADEGEYPRKPRHRLQKSNSDGGNLNLKARQQAMMAPSPAVPNFPRNMPGQPSPAAAHFPQSTSTQPSPAVAHSPHGQQHQAYNGNDVPASAAMF